jgi:glycosyltransferase involved in cell wall biosynthesis
MISSQPLVSVLLSVWNAGEGLEDALESLGKQTYQHLEILIMNDASTDRSAFVLEKFQTREPRCTIFTHAENRGLTKSLNELAKRAKGEFLARMDADDVADPTRIEKQMYFLMQHPEVSVCGTRGWLMNEDTGEESFLDVPVGVLSKKQLIYHNQCLHPSLVIKRSVFDLVGGYDERFKRSQDYELLLRILRVAPIANIPDRLIRYRFSSKSFLKYGKKQEWYAFCARVRAIMMGGYPIVYGVFWIVLRFLWLIVPQSIKFSKTYGDRKKS